MHIPEIVGQDEALRLLDREMASGGRMSHAYLLWGGPRGGSGKMALAKRVALAANCMNCGGGGMQPETDLSAAG